MVVKILSMLLVRVMVVMAAEVTKEAGVGGLSDVSCSCPLVLTPFPTSPHPLPHAVTSPIVVLPSVLLIPRIVSNLSAVLGSVLTPRGREGGGGGRGVWVEGGGG